MSQIQSVSSLSVQHHKPYSCDTTQGEEREGKTEHFIISHSNIELMDFKAQNSFCPLQIEIFSSCKLASALAMSS